MKLINPWYRMYSLMSIMRRTTALNQRRLPEKPKPGIDYVGGYQGGANPRGIAGGNAIGLDGVKRER